MKKKIIVVELLVVIFMINFSILTYAADFQNSFKAYGIQNGNNEDLIKKLKNTGFYAIKLRPSKVVAYRTGTEHEVNLSNSAIVLQQGQKTTFTISPGTLKSYDSRNNELLSYVKDYSAEIALEIKQDNVDNSYRIVTQATADCKIYREDKIYEPETGVYKQGDSMNYVVEKDGKVYGRFLTAVGANYYSSWRVYVYAEVIGVQLAKQGKEIKSNLVTLNIPGLNNVVKVVVGTVITGVGVVILRVLTKAKLPVPTSVVGPTGIPDGAEKVLKGKTDDREYHIKYDAEKDEWTNTETGNIFIPERFEGWQQDLAKDWQQSSKEREKMSNRDTEFDREVKKSVKKDKEDAELLKKLHYMRKILNLQRTDAGRINRPPGEPGSMTDKINKLEDQLINGKSVDKELLKKVQRIYTKASNGKISGYHDLPNINVGQEFVDGMKLTGKEIFSGSSKKALVLRGLLGIATGGTAAVAIEMGMEVASAGFVIKDYVDKGGDSVVDGIILAAGNTLISEGAGQVTGRYLKYLSNQSSRAFHNFAANTKEGYKLFKKFDHLKSGKVSIKGKDISIGLKDEMIDRVIENTSEIGKNIFVAPPFQDVYKSFFIK